MYLAQNKAEFDVHSCVYHFVQYTNNFRHLQSRRFACKLFDSLLPDTILKMMCHASTDMAYHFYTLN